MSQALVDEQAALMGVASVPLHMDEGEDAASTDLESIRLSPKFASHVISVGGEGALRFVIAHELGHARGGAGGGHGGELEADRWAAHSLVHAGVGPEAIEGVMSTLPSESSETHPGAGVRSAHAKSAWAQMTETKAVERRDSARESLLRDR